jgi:hypothetical protein
MHYTLCNQFWYSMLYSCSIFDLIFDFILILFFDTFLKHFWYFFFTTDFLIFIELVWFNSTLNHFLRTCKSCHFLQLMYFIIFWSALLIFFIFYSRDITVPFSIFFFPYLLKKRNLFWKEFYFFEFFMHQASNLEKIRLLIKKQNSCKY